MTFGGTSESPFGGPNQQVIEREFYFEDKQGQLHLQHRPRGGPVPPPSGCAISYYRAGKLFYVVVDDGRLMRCNLEKSAPRWVETARFIDAPTPRFVKVTGRDSAGRFAQLEVRMQDEHVVAPALVCAGFLRRSESMGGTRFLAWAVTVNRQLVALDIESGQRSTIGGRIPGEARVLAADPIERMVLMESGDLLRWSPRGWFSAGSIGAPEPSPEAAR